MEDTSGENSSSESEDISEEDDSDSEVDGEPSDGDDPEELDGLPDNTETEEKESRDPNSLGSPVSVTLQRDAVRDTVVHDVNKFQARQHRKYHSKKSSRAGRPHGSKSKQDKRVKMDGFWD